MVSSGGRSGFGKLALQTSLQTATYFVLKIRGKTKNIFFTAGQCQSRTHSVGKVVAKSEELGRAPVVAKTEVTTTRTAKKDKSDSD